MPLFKGNAVVLRSMDLFETDRLITFMTEDRGKIKCVAKASRKMKNRYGAGLEPMSHIHIVYFGKENQDLYRLNSCDIIESFQKVRENYQKVYMGIYFLELTDNMLRDAHYEPKIYNLLTDTLHALKNQNEIETLCRLYEMKILALSGYKPLLTYCTKCQKTPQSKWVGFSYNNYGILCGECSDLERTELKFRAGTLEYLKKLLTLEPKQSGRLKFPKTSEEEIEKISHRLIQVQLGREPKSYPFIKMMAG
ncbi:MAG: DNA repair protein RecO [Nitrospinales bacterium]